MVLKILNKYLIVSLSILFLLSACSESDKINSPRKVVFVDETGQYVIFEGRWRILSETGSTKIPKINTVKCICFRQTMTCNEITSKLFLPHDKNPHIRNILYHDTFDFKIIEWTPKLIHAKREAPVADIELRISLSDKSVEKSFRETKARGSETADANIQGHWVLD